MLECFKGTMFLHPTPEYQGSIQFTVYAPGVIYVLAFGAVISTIGVIILSQTKGSRFLIAILIINAPLLYFIWRGSTPGILI